jgi:ankyrin repeat protein
VNLLSVQDKYRDNLPLVLYLTRVFAFFTQKGLTALLVAATENRTAVANTLLRAGADPNVQANVSGRFR